MDFYADRKIKASRRAYRCQWCNELIPKGAAYTYGAGTFEDDFFFTRLHNECAEAIPKWYDANRCWGEGFPDDPMERGGIRPKDEVELINPI